MRTLFRTMFSTVAVVAALAAAPAAAALTLIDTTPNWNGITVVGALGSPSTGVFGQTFVAPTNVINSFTFYVDDGGTPFDVFGAVYAWSGNLVAGNPTQGATGEALFVSDGFSTVGEAGLNAVTVNTGDTALLPGQSYVVLLAATSSDVQAFFGVIRNSPPVAGNGGFNYFNNDFDIGVINNGDWDSSLNFGTLAWVGDFGGTVPEPQNWALMLIGFGAMGVAMRRRRMVAA